MALFTLFALFLLNSGFCSEVTDKRLHNMVIPCRHDDMQCMDKSIKLFAEKTSAGMPEYHLTGTDPYVVPDIEIRRGDLTYRFTKLYLYGMKNKNYVHLKIEPHSYEQVTKLKPTVHADLEVESADTGNIYCGKIKVISNSTLVGTRFPFLVLRHFDGTRHFYMDQEVIDAGTETKPSFILNSEPVNKDASSHPHALNGTMYEVCTQVINQLAKEASAVALDNIRVMCKIVTANDFMSDVDEFIDKSQDFGLGAIPSKH